MAEHIELFKGKGIQPWYVRLVAENRQTLAVSEGYFSKWNAKRMARKTFQYTPRYDTTVKPWVEF